MRNVSIFHACVFIALSPALFSVSAGEITGLDQHFDVPGAAITPWGFGPKDNIKEISTSERPGLLQIYEAGRGKDIKGLLEHPIRIDDYPLPWEFQLALVQNGDVISGVRTKTQCNTAIGLNLAVTFSDPDDWPKDRTQPPPDTRSVQLLGVHLGASGETGAGLPQYSDNAYPELYLIWGRGDLGHTVMGDWKIPYVLSGSVAKYEVGPASRQLYFRAVIRSPTTLQIGVKFKPDRPWEMRTIDCSKYGQITGIWEIGPIISADRWIPDVLCRSLPVLKGPDPLMLGSRDSSGKRLAPEDYRGSKSKVWIDMQEPEPPDPQFQYYVDYCAFLPSSPVPFEDLSDDFDVLGFLGKWRVQNLFADTHTKPGYMTLMPMAGSQGGGFCHWTSNPLDLAVYPPPWEIEIAYIAPDDSIPWNLFTDLTVYDTDGERFTSWHPGIQNHPKEGKHRLVESTGMVLEFDEEIPESVLAHKPLRMLLQCVDDHTVRLGFKGADEGSWYFSKPYDVFEHHGRKLGQFGMHCWSTNLGSQRRGVPPGAPMYQKFFIDYVHYRYGLSD